MLIHGENLIALQQGFLGRLNVITSEEVVSKAREGNKWHQFSATSDSYCINRIMNSFPIITTRSVILVGIHSVCFMP